MHGARYDQVVADGMRPYQQLFGDDLGPGGWDNINRAHIALIEQSLDRHVAAPGSGKRILIMFGAWHKYHFLRALAARPDIRLRSLREFLVPPAGSHPDSQSGSQSDVAGAQAAARR
jgi:hypothetical protein